MGKKSKGSLKSENRKETIRAKREDRKASKLRKSGGTSSWSSPGSGGFETKGAGRVELRESDEDLLLRLITLLELPMGSTTNMSLEESLEALGSGVVDEQAKEPSNDEPDAGKSSELDSYDNNSDDANEIYTGEVESDPERRVIPGFYPQS